MADEWIEATPADVTCLEGANDVRPGVGIFIQFIARYTEGRLTLKVSPEQEAIIKIYAERVGEKIGRLVSEIIVDSPTSLWTERPSTCLRSPLHTPSAPQQSAEEADEQ